MSGIKWSEEIKAVIRDIQSFVKEINVSKYQPDINRMVFFNVETFENNKFCIKLCESGFGIASNHDHENATEIEKWYETPYAMLSEISKSYMELFQQSLIAKLRDVENK